MYYEEKVINGILHYRGNPDDEFTPYTIERLTQMYLDRDQAATAYNQRLQEVRTIVN